MWFQGAGGRGTRHEQRKDSKHETCHQAEYQRRQPLAWPKGFSERQWGRWWAITWGRRRGKHLTVGFSSSVKQGWPQEASALPCFWDAHTWTPSGSFKARRTPGRKQDTHTLRCEVVRLHLHPPSWSPGRSRHCIRAWSQSWTWQNMKECPKGSEP